MIVEVRKFGNILNSRPSGREAVLISKQIINGSKDINEIALDFNGVEVITPSFADEFISGIKLLYPSSKIKIVGMENNPVIKEVLDSMEKDKDS
ncbi:MAG: STAS-like domain-containing protein [Parcubacteria group bacterium]|jgi:hypothetical protein